MSDVPCARVCQYIGSSIDEPVKKTYQKPAIVSEKITKTPDLLPCNFHNNLEETIATRPEPIIKVLSIRGEVIVVQAKDAGKRYTYPIPQDTTDRCYRPSIQEIKAQKSLYQRFKDGLYSSFNRVFQTFIRTNLEE